MSDLTGSSPLTRGKRRDEAYLIHGMRLIPAHAGKTSPKHWAQQPAAAHPRSRGEKRIAVPRASNLSGSSPLAREKLLNAYYDGHRVGSSPLARGKPPLPLLPLLLPRLIPARAGKTFVLGGWAMETRGSSPLARGKPGAVAARARVAGLIPARAGKTKGGAMHRPKGAAHPRSRGENPLSRAASAAEDGSSPLARGKHRRPARQPRPPGLIPARAGKTCFQRQKSSCRRAHPRSRGENSAAGRPIRTSWGSSPLTRGKRSRRDAGALHRRLIPAHAGKT